MKLDHLKTLFPIKDSHYKGCFFIVGLNKKNYHFRVGICKGKDIIEIGSFSEGIGKHEADTLIKTILSNKKQTEDDLVSVDPGICITLYFRAIENNQLIDPYFDSFQLEQHWKRCTWDRLIVENTPVYNEINITHPDKTIWEEPFITKEAFISYLIQISPFILPFLQNRILTTIRYPHGVPGEAFFQKNCPNYAPSFVQTEKRDDIQYIVCDHLSTLVWLGNQLAIEYHVPFQTIDSSKPLEIVFDLDPPNKDHFSLAIKAALEIKNIFERFNIKSYPKLSGSKGLQIHIPINNTSLTYNDTKIFTTFIATYLVELHPNDFTIERMKKNRGNKLYIDYIQHAEGKTIICPYSTRGKKYATVAAPLFWEEINENLRIEDFNIPSVLKRLTDKSCPMNDFFDQDNPSLIEIIASLKAKNIY
ncbi:DNA ligase D [Bacillus ginsengihumi]|uniref:DNA ligase D n=1 Tax=Heyndrickxia ginsengihumi TaxID=363870 RepID=A0A0A6VFS7_9BACI|nr:DNA ligase D [Heyndrickxia ginsengihumi]KHD85479.1 DNA polymerase LigD, polymerase domain-containing protein [Heyndrickxia ginsengihumi]NEY20728.1 DNA ligase D [Heyndrickxia ginsengihumi]